MAEAVYKRTNFFDGQFLKQGEFLGMEEYHRHMRRRLLYVLFDKSGVVPYGGTDLAIEVFNSAAKQIRVKAGTALGRRDDLTEAKEIVLQADQIIDLNLVTPALGTGSTGIVTIHYAEQETDPSTEGGVPGNTRVTEQAILTVHRRNTVPPDLSSPTAPNGEPYVRLGYVVFDSLNITTPRDVAYLKTTLMAPTATLGISPNLVTAGGPITLALASSGGLDLSTLVTTNITITPMTGITLLAVPAASRTPNAAIVTFDLATLAPAGPRPFSVTVGTVTAQTTLTVQSGLQVTGFTPVPVGGTMFELTGSGFGAGATVEFTATTGGFVAAPAILAGNITPTTIRIPLADIPATATQGPVRVSSGSQVVISAASIIPPARIDGIEGGAYVLGTAPPPGTPNAVVRGNRIQIRGRRFFATNLIVRIGTYATTAFPTAALGETRTDEVLQVFVPTSVPTGARVVSVEHGGGVVQAPTPLTVTT